MGKNWPYTPYMKLRQRAGKKGVMFVRSRVWEVHCKNHSKKWVFFNWNNEITKKNVWAGLICGQHPIPSSSPRLPLKIPGCCCWTVFSRLWRENVRFSTGRPLPPNTTTKCERERIFRIRWIETFRAQDGMANGTQTNTLSTTTQAISSCSKLPRPLARIRQNWASNFREKPTQIQNKG